MAEEDRNLSPFVPHSTALSTNVVSRAIAHAKQFVGNRSRSLAAGEDIFTAIRRCDVPAVERILSVCPTVVFSLNAKGNPPLLDALTKYLSNKSYWQWINGERSPPVPKPISGDADELLGWQKRLWKLFVLQQESLVSILENIRRVDPTEGWRLRYDDTDVDSIADCFRYAAAKVAIAFGLDAAYRLSNAHKHLGNWTDAITTLQKVTRVKLIEELEKEELEKNANRQIEEIKFDIALLLFCCPDEKIQDREKAVEILVNSVQSNRTFQWYISHILAWEGDFDRAIIWAQKVVHSAALELKLLQKKIDESASIANDLPLWKMESEQRRRELLLCLIERAKDSISCFSEKRVEFNPPAWTSRPKDWPWSFPDGLSRQEWIEDIQWFNRCFMLRDEGECSWLMWVFPNRDYYNPSS